DERNEHNRRRIATRDEPKKRAAQIANELNFKILPRPRPWCKRNKFYVLVRLWTQAYQIDFKRNSNAAALFYIFIKTILVKSELYERDKNFNHRRGSVRPEAAFEQAR
ncbi:hypothetical protein, partial [uncultured Campylobacter sp.]|uniref:hypothetical protein n=1 Tax=uncultured Campylobacter sp. TaxID=218934 RepID=UPI002606FEFA